MVSSWIDLDTHEERPVTLDYPKFNREYDFHEEICTKDDYARLLLVC